MHDDDAILGTINEPVGDLLSPLHFAGLAGLTKQTQILLGQGADSDVNGASSGASVTALHLAIVSASGYGARVDGGVFEHRQQTSRW